MGVVCEVFVSIVSEASFAMLAMFVDIGVDAALNRHTGTTKGNTLSEEQPGLDTAKPMWLTLPAQAQSRELLTSQLLLQAS